MERKKLVRRAYNRIRDYFTGEDIYGARGLKRLEHWLEDKVWALEMWLFVPKQDR